MARIDTDRMRRRLFHLSKAPLPFRKANFTRPGQDCSTLDEADRVIEAALAAAGYAVRKQACQVQALRYAAEPRGGSNYARPEPGDPWYTVHNLVAERSAEAAPGAIVLVSHKDSQSWVDSPGAHDNCVGTVAHLEIAAALSDYRPRHVLRFLFCNEEHVPWTSEAAAREMRDRGERLAGVWNLDGVGATTPADRAAGVRANVTGFATPEGEALADLTAEVVAAYAIPLRQSKVRRPHPNDDDGSFVKAGFPAAVIQIGSFPYADPNYHQPGDVPELVDVENVRLAAQATLAAVLHLDQTA